ncbi:uncharacterized protein LOC131929883 [Physella acuta]|uniref:uncharacterized protein LOC131929883 n=1 Tax=Physella acuta TaxID=109671 RepID=UPI0027DE81F6|nr:uncharacterized protein LOC131929883 [Physella acuta]
MGAGPTRETEPAVRPDTDEPTDPDKPSQVTELHDPVTKFNARKKWGAAAIKLAATTAFHRASRQAKDRQAKSSTVDQSDSNTLGNRVASLSRGDNRSKEYNQLSAESKEDGGVILYGNGAGSIIRTLSLYQYGRAQDIVST